MVKGDTEVTDECEAYDGREFMEIQALSECLRVKEELLGEAESPGGGQ